MAVDDNNELPKYRIIEVKRLDEFEREVNALVEQGYALKTFIYECKDHDPYVALMELKDKGKYEDIDSMIKVDLEDVDLWLEKGYEVSEVYSKHAVLIHRGGKNE